MTSDELSILADYAAGLFAAGRGPRVDTPGAALAWADLMESCGLQTFGAARGAIKAFAAAGKHGGWWDPGAFVQSLQAAADDQTEGEAWAEACRLVSCWADGALVRAPLPDGWVRRLPEPAPVLSMAELQAGDPAQQRLARAILAVGVESIRMRRPQDEGTLRAQFREALREAARTQARVAVMGGPGAGLGAITDGAAPQPQAGPKRIDVAQVLPVRRLV